MENFNLLDGSDTLKLSRDMINNNLLSVRSLSSGTAFPTDNLSDGMLCYRTDLKRLYQYQENGSWSADIAMNINGNANTANNAGTAATANRATVADSCTGNSATATTAETCTGNSATATKLKSAISINNVAFDGTKNINIPVGVKTVNGIEPSEDGDVVVAGVPIGFEYISFNPNTPTGSLPLLGGTFSRTAYKDLWAWVQTQTNYLISESAWQAKATANEGNVPFYSTGDGSTTFRVPSLSCWVKGANGVSEVGSYLKAGLPNIEGYVANLGLNANESKANYSGAFIPSASTINYGNSSSGNPKTDLAFDASASNSIYGASNTVQPPSVVGMWLVKAFGTVSNVGNQDVADISAGLTTTETRLAAAETNIANMPFTARATSIGGASTTKPAVIVSSYRSDNNWYRVWSDGWVEQGGLLTATGSEKTISLHKPMADTNYTAQITLLGNVTGTCYAPFVHNTSATTITFYGNGNTVLNAKKVWVVYGKGA
jgi:hypothetical protein